MIFIALFPLLLPSLAIALDFIVYLFTNKRLYSKSVCKICDVLVIVGLPLFYLILDPAKNECCTDSATFSPEHKLTICILIAISVLAAVYSIFKKKVLSPVLEVLVNSTLLLGFVLNLFVALQVEPFFLGIMGNLPISMVFIFQLLSNQNQFLDSNFIQKSEVEKLSNPLEKIAWEILHLEPILKYPIFLILALPILPTNTVFQSLIICVIMFNVEDIFCVR